MSLCLRIYTRQLQALIRELPERRESLLESFKEEGSMLIMTEMRFNAPLGKTGFLRESVKRRLTPKGFTVWPDADYAIHVEEGTQPHFIFPRKAKALRWFGAYGQPLFAAWVRHPGFKGRWFVRFTKLSTVGRMYELAQKLVGEHMTFV